MRLIPAMVVVLGALVLAQGAQKPSLDEVLASATKYVTAFEGRLAGLVAEERYQQEVRSPTQVSDTNLSRLNPGGGFRSGREQHRVLRSDFLLVQLMNDGGWMPFRDVFEVDGRPVRDREDRLAALFIKQTASSFAQAERIMEDSTRYNLGSVMRNINIPILAQQLLHPNVIPRITFSPSEDETIDGWRTWRIDFRETRRPTLVKTTGERDLPLSGKLWIEPATGVVLKTTLRAADKDVRADITVTYRHDPKLEMWLPATMDETYKARGDSGEILGHAAYSNYRRFQVSTDEAIKKPGG